MATRIHFKSNDLAACGRGTRLTENVHQVDCRACGKRPEYIDAMATAQAAKLEAFLAQEPREFAEPWREGKIVCGGCMGTLFREADRTCYGHYANYVCAQCGETTQRLTETGMSF
jgi:DNA-directed RNA polymerase subunit RPC12/RpoP